MKKTLSLLTLFLLASLSVNAQIPEPTGDDGDNGGDIIFYFACHNSDGTAVFTRFPNLSPEERAALCDNDDDDGMIEIPFG